jgi:ankyrin repeat protein
MLNPEFAQPNFQPDPAAPYKVNSVATATRFNYLQALVMSGAERIEAELAPFIRDHYEEAKKQAQHKTSDGRTALIMAVRQPASVSMLIPISDARAKNHEGYTALMFAAALSFDVGYKVVQLLLPVSDVNAVSVAFGRTALHESIAHGTVETAEVLIATSDCTVADKYGITALMSAVNKTPSKNGAELIRLLIKKSNIDARCNIGSTAIEWALCGHQSMEIIADIIKAMDPAVIKNNTNRHGNTALHTAILAYLDGRIPLQAVIELIPYSNKLIKNNKEHTVLGEACVGYASYPKKALEVIDVIIEGLPAMEILNAVRLQAVRSHTDPLVLLAEITARQSARLAERATLSAALKEGIGLPGALALTYL